MQEVDEPAKEVVPVEAACHQTCPGGHQNSEPARNLRVTSSPLARGTRARMGTCVTRPKRRWQYTSAIGTKYGDKAAQEWTSKKHIVSKEPKYSHVIEIRHAKRVQATKERLNHTLTSLTAELKAIDDEIKQDFNNHDLEKERHKINEQILKCETDVKDEVEMKLSDWSTATLGVAIVRRLMV